MPTGNTEGPDGYEQVTTLTALRENDPVVTQVDGTPIAVFHHEGEVRAVNNQCPHMGFPLSEGTVDEGILTCDWHHARFELSCGDTFDPWADDLEAYPTDVADGRVYVDATPQREEPPAAHWQSRLSDGLEQNLRLVIAKSAVGLHNAGVPPEAAVEQGILFGTRYREGGWSSGLTILTALSNVIDELEPQDQRRALYHGLTEVAGDCADQPPKFDQAEFTARDVAFDRLKSWFRENVEVRDANGAERVLRTAVASGCSPAQLTELLVTAATDHRYLDTGHTFDYVNKATEALDTIGWDHDETADVLASLVRGLVDAERSEELSTWRQPVDLAGLCEETFDELDALVAAGEKETWEKPAGFTDRLHADDPAAVFETLREAIREGATVQQLAGAVAHAAAKRITLFTTGNEFNDWNTVLHTFTYANAVHRVSRLTDTTELYRGVFDAAVNVYLDRFLTTPPAPYPEPTPDADPAEQLEAVQFAFESQGEVNRAGSAAAAFLDAGGDPSELKATLGTALLQEDTNFHTYQVLEAGFQQFDARTDSGALDAADASEVVADGVTGEQRDVLIAVARYMAAHYPTRREREQTFSIAARLLRGETVHDDGGGTATADD